MSWHEQFMDDTPEGRELRDAWRRQVVLETRAVEAAAARYRRDLASAVQRGEGANMPAARRLLLRWFPPLVEAIREEQRQCYLRESQVDRSVYGPLLLLLEPEQLAVIAMHCTLNAVMALADGAGGGGACPGQTRVTRLALNIGRMIENQVNLEKLQSLCRRQSRTSKEIVALQEEGAGLRRRLEADGRLSADDWSRWRQLGAALEELGFIQPLDHLEWFLPQERLEERLARLPAMWSRNAPIGQGSRKVMAYVKKALDPEDLEAWRGETLAKVGAALIVLLMRHCTVDVRGRDGAPATEPAFWHQLELVPEGHAARGGLSKRYGMLCAHEEVLRRVAPSQMVEAFIPQYVPMLLPPVPWLRHNRGGHITLRNTVMRWRGSHLQAEVLARKDEEMEAGRGPGCRRVYEALTALGETAWQTNRDVHRVAEAIWALGGGGCDIPRRLHDAVPPVLRAGYAWHRHERGGGFALFDYGKAAAPAAPAARRRLKRRNNELH